MPSPLSLEGKAARESGRVFRRDLSQSCDVEGFDVDQIWEHVELVNGPLIAHVTKQVERMSHAPVHSLVPRPFGGGGGKNGLVYTVCACVKYLRIPFVY